MYLMCRHHVLREICLQQMEIIQNKHEQDLDTECWRRNKLGSWLYKHTDLCLVLDKIWIFYNNIFTSDHLHHIVKETIGYRNFKGIICMEF